MKRFSSLLLIFLMGTLCNATYGQMTTSPMMIRVDNICMLRVGTYPDPVSLTLSTSIAGSKIPPATSSNAYLKITSITQGASTRKITATLSNGTLPSGTQLFLSAAACSSAARGTTTARILSIVDPLSRGMDLTLIENIGSCYTGNGFQDGYHLTFRWQTDPNHPEQIYSTSGSTVITISFTIGFEG